MKQDIYLDLFNWLC